MFAKSPMTRLSHIPGQPLSVLNHSQSTFLSYYVQLDLVLLQLVVTVVSCWAPQRRVWLHPHANSFFYSRRLQLISPILSSSPGWANMFHHFLDLICSSPQLNDHSRDSFQFENTCHISMSPKLDLDAAPQELGRSHIPLVFLAMLSVKAALYSAPLPRPLLQSCEPGSPSPVCTATRDLSIFIFSEYNVLPLCPALWIFEAPLHGNAAPQHRNFSP